jgi:hypothetical protein
MTLRRHCVRFGLAGVTGRGSIVCEFRGDDGDDGEEREDNQEDRRDSWYLCDEELSRRRSLATTESLRG